MVKPKNKRKLRLGVLIFSVFFFLSSTAVDVSANTIPAASVSLGNSMVMGSIRGTIHDNMAVIRTAAIMADFTYDGGLCGTEEAGMYGEYTESGETEKSETNENGTKTDDNGTETDDNGTITDEEGGAPDCSISTPSDLPPAPEPPPAEEPEDGDCEQPCYCYGYDCDCELCECEYADAAVPGFASAFAALASGIDNGDDFQAAIQYAIDNNIQNTTITLTGDITFDNEDNGLIVCPNFNRTFTIIGDSPYDRNVTITRTYPPNQAVLFIEAGGVTLTNVDIIDSPGAGIEVTFAGNSPNGGLVLNNVTVSGNQGGGIRNVQFLDDWGPVPTYVYFDFPLTLRNSIITNNHVNGDGGGIYMGFTGATSWTPLILDNVEISHNTATGRGGGLFIHGRRINTVSDSVIYENTAEYGGGIAFHNNHSLNNQVGGLVVEYNNATRGGGIFADFDTVSGINFVWSPSIFLSGIQILSNNATHGGGIYSMMSVHSEPGQHGVVRGNTAAGDGGGIHLNRTAVRSNTFQGLVDGWILDDNTARRGGGLFHDANRANSLWDFIINISVTNNNADYGGGIYAAHELILWPLDLREIWWDNLYPFVRPPLITGNTAVYDGGGIFGEYAVFVVDAQVTDNTAGRNGGGAFAMGNLEIRNSLVNNNSAGEDGGGAFAYTNLIVWRSPDPFDSMGVPRLNNVHLRTPELSNNTAGRDGGGAFVNAVAQVFDGRIADNEAGGDGGGIYSASTGVHRILMPPPNNAAPHSRGEGSISITGNTATGDGGGIWIAEDRLEHLFIGRAAAQGGSTVTFEDNTAGRAAVWAELPDGIDEVHDDNIIGVTDWSIPEALFGFNNFDISFRPPELTVTFEPNGGQFTVSAETGLRTVWPGDTVTDIPAVSRQHFALAGWFVDGGSVRFTNETQVMGNMTVTARWNPIMFDVTFDFGDGRQNVIVPVQSGQSVGSEMPDDPARDNYTFGGWFIGNEQFDPDSMISGDITVTARWERITHNVDFHLNGGNFSITDGRIDGWAAAQDNDVTRVTVDQGATLNLFNPTRPGHTFTGWFADSGLTTPITAATLTINGPRSLFAGWEAIPLPPNYVNVFFHLNGGNFVIEDGMFDDWEVEHRGDYIQVKVREGASLTLFNPTRADDYSFNGWYRDSGLTNRVDGLSLVNIRENTHLHAAWVQNYIVNFHLHLGRIENFSRVTDAASESDDWTARFVLRPLTGRHEVRVSARPGTTLDLSLFEPIRDGWEFTGWFDNADADADDIVLERAEEEFVIESGLFTSGSRTLNLHAGWNLVIVFSPGEWAFYIPGTGRSEGDITVDLGVDPDDREVEIDIYDAPEDYNPGNIFPERVGWDVRIGGRRIDVFVGEDETFEDALSDALANHYRYDAETLFNAIAAEGVVAAPLWDAHFLIMRDTHNRDLEPILDAPERSPEGGVLPRPFIMPDTDDPEEFNALISEYLEIFLRDEIDEPLRDGLQPSSFVLTVRPGGDPEEDLEEIPWWDWFSDTRLRPRYTVMHILWDAVVTFDADPDDRGAAFNPSEVEFAILEGRSFGDALAELGSELGVPGTIPTPTLPGHTFTRWELREADTNTTRLDRESGIGIPGSFTDGDVLSSGMGIYAHFTANAVFTPIGGGGGFLPPPEVTPPEEEEEEEEEENGELPPRTVIPGYTVIPAAEGEEEFTVREHRLFISGYPDGTVQPDGYITRVETAQILFNSSENIYRYEVGEDAPFLDVLPDDWFFVPVRYLVDRQVISGFPDDYFRPNQAIINSEFASLLSLFFELDDSSPPGTFGEHENHWALHFVRTVFNPELFERLGDGYIFAIEGPITRAQAVVLLNHYLGRVATPSAINAYLGDEQLFPDLDRDHWAFYEMMEAAITHWYVMDEDGEYEIWWNWLERGWLNRPGGR